MNHKIHKLEIIEPCKARQTPCGFRVVDDDYYSKGCKYTRYGSRLISETSKDWKKVTCKNCLKHHTQKLEGEK